MPDGATLARLLIGLAPELMVPFGAAQVHQDIFPALAELKAAAARNGFELAVASGFRGFELQREIWNEKARCERTLLDDEERAIDAMALDPDARMFAILRWSALPGGSRHHWGTDVDVFDRVALPTGQPMLRRDETVPGAIFGALHAWLDANAQRYGFYRPYDQDRGGVSPEPWHLSHIELSGALRAQVTPDVLERTVRGGGLELEDSVLRHLDLIYRRYVNNVASPPLARRG